MCVGFAAAAYRDADGPQGGKHSHGRHSLGVLAAEKTGPRGAAVCQGGTRVAGMRPVRWQEYAGRTEGGRDAASRLLYLCKPRARAAAAVGRAAALAAFRKRTARWVGHHLDKTCRLCGSHDSISVMVAVVPEAYVAPSASNFLAAARAAPARLWRACNPRFRSVDRILPHRCVEVCPGQRRGSPSPNRLRGSTTIGEPAAGESPVRCGGRDGPCSQPVSPTPIVIGARRPR